MNAEPLVIKSGIWWTIRLHPDQSQIGQIEFVVNNRLDGTWAKDLTELDVQEQLIFHLLSRTAKQTIEQLYHPRSFRWVSETDGSDRCVINLVPLYLVPPVLKMTHEEIREVISQKMELVRTGRA